ncbi:colicin immunity protein [Marinimicrococcus flavescens]|uniref:Colicin immunity protein n=1 Tax=Marinimicrococcus flavescens TaxID=3031815 RepID=A0AAP3UYQ8_9PROT|nr:colicin immunity protein [Marinimicrococcus flavescens]
MRVDENKLYESGDDFFNLEGNWLMLMTPDAAVDACMKAVDRGIVVVRVEGGIWHSDTGPFEMRYDCIWDGDDPPMNSENALENNVRAADFIRSMNYNAFILGVASIRGYGAAVEWKSKNI